jgi:hypothetical protein
MNCDACGKSFDILSEGMGHPELFTACGKLSWAIELRRREIGGVLTRRKVNKWRLLRLTQSQLQELSGGFAYRYQYQTAAHHYFGYTDTLEEAQAILREAGVYE